MRLKYLLPTVLCLLSSVLCCLPALAAIDDCINATCRITAGAGKERACGTGCVFEIKRGHVFVLTAAHIVADKQGRPLRTVQCEFWQRGYQSIAVAGRVIARSTGADSAIVAVPTASLAGWLPGVVPIAPRGLVVRPGDTVTSVGCARGAWPTGWKGHVLAQQGGDLYFTPTPADGRSGSAIFDADGRHIVGLLRARRDKEPSQANYGIATYLPALYQAFENKVQCEGGVCPSGNCQISPWRRLQEKQQQQPQQQQQPIAPQQGIWPSMPAPAQSVDLDPLQKALDDISSGQRELIELLKEKQRPPAIEPLPLVPDIDELADAAAEKAAEVVKVETAAATEQLKEEVTESRAETSRLAGAIDALKAGIGDVSTLRERIDTRLEKIKAELPDDASRKEIIKGYVKDLVGEKISGTSSMTIGTAVAQSLGLGGPIGLGLGLGLMALRRRLKKRIITVDDKGKVLGEVEEEE